MERGSDKHSARMDDALEAETRGMMTAGRETRGEEWNSPEPSGEDQPDVDRVPDGTLAGGVPEGMTEGDVAEPVLLDGLGRYGGVDLAAVRQLDQRCDGDRLRVDVEVPAQRCAGVGAAEAVGAQ